MQLDDNAAQLIDHAVAEAALDTHPFVVAWRSGQLSRNELRQFAGAFHHVVDALPRCAARAYSGTLRPEVRRPLAGFIWAMDGAPPTPSDLWLQTCAALGLFSDTLRRAEPSPGVAGLCDELFRQADGPDLDGIAGLYTLLMALPPIFRAQRDGMRAYDMSVGPGLEFFDRCSHLMRSLADALRDVLVTGNLATSGAGDSILGALRKLLDEVTSPALPAISLAG